MSGLDEVARLLCVSPMVVDAWLNFPKLAQVGDPGRVRISFWDALEELSGVRPEAHEGCAEPDCETCHEITDARDAIIVGLHLERIQGFRSTRAGLVPAGVLCDREDENGPYREPFRERSIYLSASQVDCMKGLLARVGQAEVAAMVRRAVSNGAKKEPSKIRDWIVDDPSTEGWAKGRDNDGRIGLQDPRGNVHALGSIRKARDRLREGDTDS